MASASNSPLSTDRLEQIASKACDAIFANVSEYEHKSTQGWNNEIINKIIESLVAATTGEGSTGQYKFAVNSTIIQNSPGHEGGKRGMNSSVGGYWNTAKDGMWTYKYETREKAGIDVVITVIWMAVDVVKP